VETGPVDNWEEIAAALKAYRRAQHETWGEVDDVAIAKYLAGDCSPEERQTVEEAIRSHPAYGELIDVVKEVLEDFHPVAAAEAVPQASTEVAPQAAVPAPCWSGVGAVWELVERLAARIAEDGKMVASGFQGLLMGPQVRVAQTMAGGATGQDEVETADWKIPLPTEDGALHVWISPSRKLPAQWELRCTLELSRHAEPIAGAWIEVRTRAGRRKHRGPMDHAPDRPGGYRQTIFLRSGEFRITILLGERSLEFPVEVGSLTPDSPP